MIEIQKIAEGLQKVSQTLLFLEQEVYKMKLKINSLDLFYTLSDAQEKTDICINGVQVYTGMVTCNR